MADAAELEALRAQLAAAEAELQANKEEKEKVAEELALAQKEKAAHAKKKAYLDETGLTDAEFEDKKATVEVPDGRCMAPDLKPPFAGQADEESRGDEGPSAGTGACP